MKRWMTVMLLFLLGMSVTTIVQANDEDDVKAAVMAIYEALNNGDAAAVNKLIGDELSTFAAGGGLLTWSSGPIENLPKYSFQIQHLEVKVYGSTAVATYYRTGTGESLPGTYRISMVLNKQGGQWKQVHRHDSPLGLPGSSQ